MKALLQFSAVFLFLFSGDRVFADRGIIVGNGGHTVVCDTSRGKPTYQVFDLFEGRIHFKYRYPRFVDDSPLALALRLAAKIDQAQGAIGVGPAANRMTVTERVKWVERKMHFMPPGFTLEPTEDTGQYQVIPDNCHLVQTVDFLTPEMIAVNVDMWNKLDPSNRAALYLHEAVYWFLRDSGVEKDSRRTRRIVSYLLAGGDLTPIDLLADNAVGPVQFCHSVEMKSVAGWHTQILAYRNSLNESVLQFLSAGGYSFFNRITIRNPLSPQAPELPIEINSQTVHQLTGISAFPVDVETALELTWGTGQILLTGDIQWRNPVSDSLTCVDWTGSISGH